MSKVLFARLLFLAASTNITLILLNSTGVSAAETTIVEPPWKHCFGINRVRQSHLSLYSGYKKRFASPQGIVALKLDANDRPGQSDDDELTVYGVNSDAGEIIYNKSLASLGFWNAADKSDSALSNPIGIAAAPDGSVIIADTGNNRLVLLKNENNNLHYLFASRLDDSNQQLSGPSDVDFENDTLYVADTGNNRIIAALNRDSSLQTIRNVRPSKPLYHPFGIACISGKRFNYYNSNFIVITDSLNKRLVQISLDGRVQKVTRIYDISDRGGGFYFVEIDYYSNIYVTDTDGGCVYKFNKDLQFLSRLACSDSDKHRLEEPRGITIYRRFGQIFVAERSGASYFWVGTDVLYASGKINYLDENHSGRVLQVRFLLTEHSYVTIRLKADDDCGKRTFIENVFMAPGIVFRIYELALFPEAEKLANCKYFIEIEAVPTYASKRYLTVVKHAILKF